MASADHLLPPIYCRLFSQLQDQARGTSLSQVRQIVREELGQEVEDLFEHFDDTPVASASIAQVHKARLKDGREVAVKI